jgi:hypothetical protein
MHAPSPDLDTAKASTDADVAAPGHKIIPPPVATSYGVPARRSSRHTVAEDGSIATDEDTMQKAMRRKAAKNLDFSGMNSSSSSFVSLPTNVISSKLNSVGISLGKNDYEINVSANVLKHMEYDRLTVGPKSQNIADITETDDEEAIATLDGQLLSSLVGVVSEVDFNDSTLGSLYELQASGRKSKSSSLSRSQKRGRVPKSKIVSK